MPDLAQGYVVLSNVNQPQIKSWEVNIVEKKYNENGEVINEIIVATKKLEKGKNYLKIDSEYLAKSAGKLRYLQVAGYNNGNVKVFTETPKLISSTGSENDPDILLGGVPFLNDCQWICNSTDHAWAINRYADHHNGNANKSYYQVEEAYDYYDPTLELKIPYYEYMSLEGLIAGCAVGRFEKPGVCNSVYATINGTGYNGLSLIGPLNGNITQYVDINGYRVTGAVYGVQKGLGPWKDSNLKTGILYNGGSESCSYPFEQAISIINQNADFTVAQTTYPQLSCESQNYVYNVGGLNYGSNDCLGTFSTNNGFANFNQWISALSKCYGQSGFTDAGLVSPFEKWENVDRIIISDLNNIEKPNIVLNPFDFFKKPSTNASVTGQTRSNTNANANWNSGNGSNEGEWSGPNFTLEPSLYNIGISFFNGKYLPIVRENLTTITIKYELAELVDIEVLPVPIENNNFGLKMKAAANLNFTYQLIDTYGNQIHSQVFQLEKDHELTETINPVSGTIPSGILLNRFVFSDGSVKTMQTMRN